MSTKFNPFNSVKVDNPNSNQFDLSFDNKLTLDMGGLYPVLVQETLPGDNFNITPEALIRLAPMTFPIMHKVDLSIHFFYVPNRILHEKFPNFLNREPYAPLYFHSPPSAPLAEKIRVDEGSLLDYLGLPPTDIFNEPFSAYPWLAYHMIFNQYYQDQNNDETFVVVREMLKGISHLNGQLDLSTFEAPDYSFLYEIKKRAWQHDYFTSALPFAQKGETVNIPLTIEQIFGDTLSWEQADPSDPDGTLKIHNDVLKVDDGNSLTQTTLKGVSYSTDTDIELSGTINQLRTAMALQKFLEKNARSGTRYDELIKAHFGTDIGDARIQIPEYIGGLKNNVVISEVLQTSQTTDNSQLGQYSGHGVGYAQGEGFSYSTPEHGFIIGIMSVIPTTAYFQGINKKFSRLDPLDYYWPEFAQIGEQAIKNKELYYSLDDQNNEDFGYIPRYSEYKYNPSEVHGNFRGSMLDFHLARYFETRPNLNSEFIYCGANKRIFNVQDESPTSHSLYAHVYFNITAWRKIPFFTNPSGI